MIFHSYYPDVISIEHWSSAMNSQVFDLIKVVLWKQHTENGTCK